MGEYAVLNAFAYADSHDFTVNINQWAMDSSFETLDRTTMRNNGARKFKAGLRTANLTAQGFTDLADNGQDEKMFASFADRVAKVWTAGNLETEGSPVCMMQAHKSSVNPGGGGQIGQLSSFSLSAQGTDRYGGVRGTLLVEQVTVSTTGAKGTAVQAGAVTADQHLFGTFHLLGQPGSSITAVLESDNASNFPSATTRITYGPLTAVGGTWATPVAGAITDDWWRIRVTAVTGSWVVAAAMAIQ
jgi:hypothetical protein